MEANDFSFIAALSSLTKGKYICENEKGLFELTEDKTKGISPKKIVEITKACFDNLQKIKSSPAKFLKTITNLKEGLDNYKEINKELDPELTIPFNYLSEGEVLLKLKEIETQIKKLVIIDNMYSATYSKKNEFENLNKELLLLKGEPRPNEPIDPVRLQKEKKIKEYNDTIKNKISDLKTQESELKEWLAQSKGSINQELQQKISVFFMKTLGSNEQEKAFIQGVPFYQAMESILTDLQKNQELREIEKELAFALEIEIAIVRMPEGNEKEREACAKKIEKAIQELSENKSMILPGGSNRHALLLQIAFESNGTYSLSIINTGEGVVKADSKAVDIKYTGITALSHEFIIKLINYRKEEDVQKNLKGIEDYFAGFPLIKKEKGRSHAVQKGNNCTIQSIFSWMNGRLGKKQFGAIKTFMAEREIEHSKEWNKAENFYPTLRNHLRLNHFFISNKRVEQIFSRVMETARLAQEKKKKN